MAKASVREFQRAWNSYNHRRKLHYKPLKVDGVEGKHTRTFIKLSRYYVGVGTEKWQGNTPDVSDRIVDLLEHPFTRHKWETKRESAKRRKLATNRCRARIHRWRGQQQPKPKNGLVHLDGKLCAAWISPWLLKAKRSVFFLLTSGFRDPAYSEGLCYRMCGRPSCPGRCAGRASNHSGIWYPHGAADIFPNQYSARAALTRMGAPLRNHLPYDSVHVSATGY